MYWLFDTEKSEIFQAFQHPGDGVLGYFWILNFTPDVKLEFPKDKKLRTIFWSSVVFFY